NAQTLATKARETLPNDPDLAKVLGVIAYRGKEFSRSAALLQESARKIPNDPELPFYLGMAQLGMNQRADAKQSLQRALDMKLSPKLAEEATRALKEIK